MMLTKAILEELYQSKHMSVQKVADELGVSRKVVSCALKGYGILVRDRSETAYLQHNKSYKIKSDLTQDEQVLYGMGIGLYWGEGNKVDEYSVRLGNTDACLISTFCKFLKVICGVDENDIHFGLQVFNDSNESEALAYWMKALNCPAESFYKTISIIPPQGKGTYRSKNKHGVVQVYVCNKRLKIWLMNEIEKYAAIAQW